MNNLEYIEDNEEYETQIEKPIKSKRKMTEKQLEALARGRANRALKLNPPKTKVKIPDLKPVKMKPESIEVETSKPKPKKKKQVIVFQNESESDSDSDAPQIIIKNKRKKSTPVVKPEPIIEEEIIEPEPETEPFKLRRAR
jgi:hypothetical protein